MEVAEGSRSERHTSQSLAPSQPRSAQQLISFLQLQYPLTKAVSFNTHFCTFSSVGYNSKQAACKLLPQGPFPSLPIRTALLPPPPLTSPAAAFVVQLFLLWVLMQACPQPLPWATRWQAVLVFYNADTLLTHRHQSSSSDTLQLSSFGFFKQMETLSEKVQAVCGGWV